MNRDDDKQLWDLLGRASQPKATSFFARDVLRRIRQEPGWVVAFRSWFTPGKLIPASAIALALAAAIVFIRPESSPEMPPSADLDPVVAKIDLQDYEVVADLDDLLASDDNNLWAEN